VISLGVVIFLISWTILDPPTPQYFYELGQSSSDGPGAILEASAYCSSNKDVWGYLAIGWNVIMLLSGSVLAYQSRDIKLHDFNESLTVGLIVYTQTIFVILRIVIQSVPADSINESLLFYCESIIFSVDTIVTSSIYFSPKFKRRQMKRSASSYMAFISRSLQEMVSQSMISKHNTAAINQNRANLSDDSDEESFGASPRHGPDTINGSSRTDLKHPSTSGPQRHYAVCRPCPSCGHIYSRLAQSDGNQTEEDTDELAVAATVAAEPHAVTSSSSLPNGERIAEEPKTSMICSPMSDCSTTSLSRRIEEREQKGQEKNTSNKSVSFASLCETPLEENEGTIDRQEQPQERKETSHLITNDIARAISSLDGHSSVTIDA